MKACLTRSPLSPRGNSGLGGKIQARPLDGCEPDVVASHPHALYVFEAKLGASFGVEPGKSNQLVREWQCGAAQAEASNKQFFLILIISHTAKPVEEVAHQFVVPPLT